MVEIEQLVKHQSDMLADDILRRDYKKFKLKTTMEIEAIQYAFDNNLNEDKNFYRHYVNMRIA